MKPVTFLLSYLKKMTQNKIIDFLRKAAADRKLQHRTFDAMSNDSISESYYLDHILGDKLSAFFWKR